MRKLENIFEVVLASAARIREIREVRLAEVETGTYRLNQYKKQRTAASITEDEIKSGTVGAEYLIKAVSKTHKRNKDHHKSKRR